MYSKIYNFMYYTLKSCFRILSESRCQFPFSANRFSNQKSAPICTTLTRVSVVNFSSDVSLEGQNEDFLKSSYKNFFFEKLSSLRYNIQTQFKLRRNRMDNIFL